MRRNPTGRFKTLADFLGGKIPESFFVRLIESLHEPLIVCNLAGRIVYANPPLEELVGKKLSELRGRPVAVIAGQRLPKVMLKNILEGAVRRGKWRGEVEISDGRDTSIPVRVSAAPIMEKDGTPVAIAALLQDVRVTHELVKELMEAKILSETVIHQSPGTIIALSTDWRVIFVNKPAREMTGLVENEFLNRGYIRQIFPTRTSRTLFLSLVRRALAGGTVAREEIPFITPDNDRRIIAATIVFLKNIQIETDGLIVFGQDVTREIELKEELEQYAYDLEQKNIELEKTAGEVLAQARLKSRFLANVSHELRTPLTSIVGHLEIIKDEIADPEHRQTLETLVALALDLGNLINNILDISKIESGKLDVYPEEFDPRGLLDEVVQTLRPAAAEKKLALVIDAPPDLPKVDLDRLKLRQILMNIVGNGIKFTAQGSIAIRVTYTPREIVFAIADTGCGIGPDDQKRIFEEFVQGDDSSTRAHAGTGLGLTISRHLVRLMHGVIALASVRGKGSVFTVTLPLSIRGRPAIEKTETAVTETSLPSIAGRKIMVADDNRINLQMIVRVLKNAGAITYSAENGREVIENVERIMPDAIVMDMIMPVINGYNAARIVKFKRATRQIPIVALTAMNMLGDRERCLAAGCAAYLNKPVNREQLIRTVAQALAERQKET